jgi:hypothetical protein
MADSQREDRFTELQQTAEAVGALASDAESFDRTMRAFEAHDAQAFQAELGKLGLSNRCHLICGFYCSKHCIFVCTRLCEGMPERPDQLPIAEWREFSIKVAELAQKRELFEKFVAVVDRLDVEGFRNLVTQFKLERFCHQLCHWLCIVRCRRVCKLLCPPPPTITAVGLIPTSQIDASGRGAGPSHPPGPTPHDNKPGGVGDHPFGGTTNVRGVFNVAGAVQYKVEWSGDAGATWHPILTPIDDYRFWPPGIPPPPPPLFDDYTRVPDGAGWYTISEMGLDGPDYLTDWNTPNDADKAYLLKLTVRNAALQEFESAVVPVRIDNASPSHPDISLELQAPDGTRRKLGCCETVEQGKGNLVIVTLTASDPNFSSISVNLLGGCGVSLAVVDKFGTPLGKTYNGNLADTGYPVPTSFEWDPWAAKVDPCCYIIDVRINDRAILGNSWSGGHGNENWQSLTIA